MENAASIDTTVQLVTPENIAFDYQVAGPFRRFPAFVIDGMLKFAAITFISIILMMIGASIGELAVALGFALVNLIWYSISWFYGVFFEALFSGKTPGKWICGIRVVSVDGHPINGVQAMLRNLLRVADFAPLISLEVLFEEAPPVLAIPTGLIGLLVMACNRRMQRLGDLAAGTMVIVDERVWRLPVTRVDDPRVPALAAFVPADFRVTQTLARALAQYAERRAYLSPARRRELARKLALPLIEHFEFRPDIDPDLLLYSLYWRTYLADSKNWTGELGSLAGASPLLRDAHRQMAAAQPHATPSAPPQVSAPTIAHVTDPVESPSQDAGSPTP